MVTEAGLAPLSAREGGLGASAQNMSIEDRAAQVRKRKEVKAD